jgi:membrane protein YqaA with SNARE-associated domain
MFQYLKNLREKILDLLYKEENSEKKSNLLMGALSFAESSFFPIPPDFFIFPLVIRKPERWLKMAVIVTISSVIGGLFGYLIGFTFFEWIGKPLVAFYHLESRVNEVGVLFQKNAFLAIFTAAFTPIPYKVFTIAGGLFEINIFSFILASILGRGGRFFAVSYASKFFGKRFGEIAIKYFNWITALVAFVVVTFFIMQIF